MEITEVKKNVSDIGSNSEFVTADEILNTIENNRTRIRNLCGMIVTVCGILISTSFLVLFFIIANKTTQIPSSVPILLFAATVCLTGSIIFSLLSVLLPTPSAIPTKLELINLLTVIYNREHRRAVTSIVFLLISIALCAVALLIFGIKVV